MGIYSERASKHFREGYNCAQSVLLAFSDEIGLDKETCLKLSSSFGGGMGRLREVCGAVTSMFAIAGMLRGYTTPNDYEAKAEHYKLIQELAKDFKTEFGTIICRELLGLPPGEDSPMPSERTDSYYKQRPCEFFIKKAAEIVETKLLNQRAENLVVQVNSNED